MAKRKTKAKATKKTQQRGGLSPDKYLNDNQLKKVRRYAKNRADLARMRGSSRAVIDELLVELLVVWVRDGKGKVSRVIDISEKLQKRLERFVKLHRKGASADDPLLMSEQGGRMQYRSVYGKIKSVGQKAGIKLHPHMLRHTYLTRLYNVEKDLRFVQDQAGHASPTTTAIYAKTNNTARKRQVEALDDEDF
ncbi:MAG: tyrosine-type recombinase/integrase [Deltaproteobacteria bacterium]|nr:tyrosine-type recombinase/integrase [Deltaproteobacteria bacterium]